MPTRRHHTKTRHGCNTCKARKVRCDEEKPVCHNCTRGNRACTYSDQVFTLPPDAATGEPQAVFPVRDMELLHHYTAFSCRIMTHEPEHLEVWQVDVPRMAFSHSFLLHGLLAVTALHKRSCAEHAQKSPLMDLARYHQQHALTLYIPLLHHINQQNCHALFAFSIVLSISTFAMLEVHQRSQSLIRHFLDTTDTLMGCTAIAIQTREWLGHGPFHFLVAAMNDMSTSHTTLDPEASKALESLLELADQVCAEPASDKAEQSAARRPAYEAAIRGLASVLAPPPGECQLSVVVSWPVMTGYEYISLLKAGDKLAMLILGHYGVALHLYGQAWMLAGLGERLTQAVVGEVDSTWRPYLAWAESRVAQPVTQPVTPI